MGAIENVSGTMTGAFPDPATGTARRLCADPVGRGDVRAGLVQSLLVVVAARLEVEDDLFTVPVKGYGDLAA